VQVPNPPAADTSTRRLPIRRALLHTSKRCTASDAASTKDDVIQESSEPSAQIDDGRPSSPAASVDDSNSASRRQSTVNAEDNGRQQTNLVRTPRKRARRRVVDTPRKTLLRKKIKHMQSSRWKMTRRIKQLKSSQRLKTTPDELNTVTKVLDASESHLTPLQFELFRSLLTAQQRNPQGYRWSVKVKLFSLQLHYKSPAVYRFVAQHLVLPSLSTLNKFVSNAVGKLEAGFSDVMMNLLKLRLNDLSLIDCHCAIVFDEMALKCQLTYDKHRARIVGYTDDGKLATHALVFMVRGLRTKWKQAIAFFFTHNTVAASQLAELITTCIAKVAGIGLSVRCIVCDQGATNVAAIKKLGFLCESPYLSTDVVTNKVYVVFDVPHIVKNVRNNLQRHDIRVGDSSTASWKHVEQFYQIDKMSAIRLAPKLTDRHLDLTSASKMRVSLAAQVLSHSVAAGMHMRIMTKELGADAAGTADFIESMDKLFDLLNSRLLKGDKPARCAMTVKNTNLTDLD